MKIYQQNQKKYKKNKQTINFNLIKLAFFLRIKN